jgi:hypothetical protein
MHHGPSGEYQMMVSTSSFKPSYSTFQKRLYFENQVIQISPNKLQPVLMTLSRVESQNRNLNANTTSKSLTREVSLGKLKANKELIGLQRFSIPKATDSQVASQSSLMLNQKPTTQEPDSLQISLAHVQYTQNAKTITSPKNKSISPTKKLIQQSSVKSRMNPNFKAIQQPVTLSPDKRQTTSKSYMNKNIVSPPKTQQRGRYMHSTAT